MNDSPPSEGGVLPRENFGLTLELSSQTEFMCVYVNGVVDCQFRVT
jgi:hypothetical protein